MSMSLEDGTIHSGRKTKIIGVDDERAHSESVAAAAASAPLFDKRPVSGQFGLQICLPDRLLQSLTGEGTVQYARSL